MNVSRAGWIAACLCLVPYAWSQGNLAHVANGGGWQTTITLLNLTTTAASARISLYSDSGTPLAAPAVGQATSSQYTISIPPNGSASLVLPDVGSTAGGWAHVDSLNGVALSGQGNFLFHRGGGNDWEGSVPLSSSTSSSAACIIPLPRPTSSSFLLPFDITAGADAGFAIANTSNTSQSIPIEFDDATGAVLLTDTLVLGPMAHTSFLFGGKYPTLSGHQGVFRVKAGSDVVSVLGLRVGGTGSFSSLIPTIH
jgi:hypothetical protein